MKISTLASGERSTFFLPNDSRNYCSVLTCIEMVDFVLGLIDLEVNYVWEGGGGESVLLRVWQSAGPLANT